MPSPAGHIEVAPLESPKRFLDLPRALYAGDPDYVPPMTAFETWQVDRRRQHAD